MTKFTIRYIFTLLLCFCVHICNAQLSAGFTASDTAGCAPSLIVHFTNTSTGATSYIWNLGNGSPPIGSTDVSGSYTTAGVYTVTLTALNGGSSSTATKIIRVYDPPTVSFTASDTAICPGKPITFTSTSIANAWGLISCSWNFGDGGTGIGTTTVYTYPASGYYNVTLFATNGPGCSSSLTKNLYIHVYNHSSVGFTGTPTAFCKAPALVSFTNSTTGAGPLTYKWSFGDGGSLTTPSPTYNYVVSGIYPVTLRVTDTKGCVDSVVKPAYISVGNIAASFTLPASVCKGVPLNFNNTSSTHISSSWTFGDGGTSGADNPVYTYTASGTYTVKLVIFDGTCYDSVTHSITVSPPPTGSFTSTPVHPCPPSVNVTYKASVPGGTSVAWLFGDGTTGTGTTEVKNYPSSVIDYVDMILTNAAGCTDTIQRIDTIFNLFLNPTGSPSVIGCAPLTVNFNVFAYSAVHNNLPPPVGFLSLAYPYAISSYSWNFSDGSPLATGATPVHTYTAAGTYNAICTITTANGCTTSGGVVINIGVPPKTTFTATPLHICAGRTISFSSATVGPVDSFYWNYGDGFDTSGIGIISAAHTYTTPGTFSATLTTKDFGCPSKTFTVADTVDPANASIGRTYVCIPNNEISFHDYSIGDDTHLWQFGDGTTSTVSNLIHTYPSLSPYLITLTTYNIKSGCRDTTTVKVDLSKPVMSFPPTQLQLCRDQIDTFTSIVGGSAAPATSYMWFVDGVKKDSINPNFIYKFQVLGTHTITMIIDDIRGCYDTLIKPNYILVAKPVDKFSFVPPSGCAPLPVSFKDASTDVTGATITNYIWTYGDGSTNTVSTSSVVHTYTSSGSYVVNEIVVDNIGCSDTLTSTASLTVYKPTAGFNANTTNVCQRINVSFFNTSAGSTSWLWMFGDGATSTLTTPVHAYTTAGVYTVTLVASDPHGCTDTFSVPSYITVNPGPTASFTMNDSFAVCPPLNVSFTNTSINAASSAWSFGDGDYSASKSPSEPYTASGFYTVQLVATSINGCTDTAIGHVNIFGYKGAFTYKPLQGCAPMYVSFKATLGTVARIVWDFSDGIISGVTLKDTITHRYTATGAYIPKLILTDTSGCVSSSTGADTIKVDTLIPDFTIIPSPGCQNSTITFNDASTSLYSSDTSWLWNFGSGVTSTVSAPAHFYPTAGTFPVILFVNDGSGCTGTVTKTVTVNPTPLVITGVTTLCQGLTSQLSDGSGGGTWGSDNTAIALIGSTGIVTGMAAGTTTITYTVPTGCFITKNVTILPLPTPIIGATGICKGLTTSLTDTTKSGAWSSSNTSVATIGAATGVVASISLGTTTITYKLPTGCLTTTTVIVTTVPKSITGPATVCMGLTAALTDAITGGAWSSSNTVVATIGPSSGIVTGVSLGAVTITYSLGTGCTVYSTIAVIPSPTAILGASVGCAGTPFTLSDATIPGSWTSNNTAVATVGLGSGAVTGVAGGVDTIVYTIGSCYTTKSVTINPTPPITGPTNICVGTSATLSNSITGGTWSSLNTAIAIVGSASGTVTGNAIGVTTIRYVLPTGCIVSTTVAIISTPALITGGPYICVGNSTTLSDATPAGSWSSGVTAIATIGSSTGIITGNSSGTVAIYYSIAPGCTAVTPIRVDPVSPIAGPGNVCIGQSIKLVDTTLTGTWASSNTAIAAVVTGTGIVTGIAVGTATISYVLPTGCTVISTITVNALPTAIAGTMYVCTGLTTTLSDATPSGIWSSGNTAIAAAGSASGVITGISAGTATISYFASGCPVTATVTVNPLPVAIAGNQVVCLGATAVLSDASGGGSGIWSSSNTTVATIGSVTGVVSGMAIGTSLITYTLTTGCLVTRVQTVNPLPTAIKGITVVCQGLTTILSDATTGGTWMSSSSSIASIDVNTGLVTGILNGTVTITYTASSCTANIVVTVNPLPGLISGGSDICLGSSATLSDAGGGRWTSSNTLVATIGSSSGLLTGVATGTATITYTLSTGCIMTNTLTVNPLPLPISGTPYLCTTTTVNLNDASGSGTWSSINTSVATIDPFGMVTGIAPGTSVISYTFSTGCAASVTATVYQYPTAILGPANVCLYATVSLSDAVTGGTWSSANTSVATIDSSTGAVTGASLGTSLIIYTIASSCNVFFTVSVMPLPLSFTVTGGGSYCAGDTGVHIGLSGSVTGDNYFLFVGSIKATGPVVGSGTSIDFGLQKVGGAYTVIGTNPLTGCSNTMTGSTVITANPVVTPTIGVIAPPGDSVCSGAATKFTEVSTGTGTTPLYEWNVNGTIVSTATFYTFIPANGDVVTCKMISNATCARPTDVSNSVKMKVLLPESPAATLSADPGDTICQGLNVTITPVPLYGGTAPTYAWMLNGLYVGSGPVFTYVPANGDVVYCKITSNYMCLVSTTARSNSMVMTVDTPIIPHVAINAFPGTSAIEGQNDTLVATVTNGGANPTFQWYVNGFPVAGANSATYVSNQYQVGHIDSISCVVTSSGICTMTTHQWVYVSAHNLAVKQPGGESAITVLPNPNKGLFTIKGILGTGIDEEVSVEVTDLLGQLVYHDKYMAKGGNINMQVSLGDKLANSTYILSLRTGSVTKVFHVIIER